MNAAAPTLKAYQQDRISGFLRAMLWSQAHSELEGGNLIRV